MGDKENRLTRQLDTARKKLERAEEQDIVKLYNEVHTTELTFFAVLQG